MNINIEIKLDDAAGKACELGLSLAKQEFCIATTGHLLYGLCKCASGIVAEVLESNGITSESVKAEKFVYGITELPLCDAKGGVCWSGNACDVLIMAARTSNFLAGPDGGWSVGIEHLLRALIFREGVAKDILEKLGVDPNAMGLQLLTAIMPEPVGG